MTTTALPPERMTSQDLRHWQLTQGHTYDSGAAALGVARSTYYNWLAGHTPIPRPIGLACAASAAGMPAYTAAPPAGGITSLERMQFLLKPKTLDKNDHTNTTG
jgi:hypothetical protein